MMKTKDDRWAKQFGDFAEGLVMYVMGRMKNMSVALIDHVGADVVAIDRNDKSSRFVISVKGRNFPKEESKSFNFTQGNIEKLEVTADLFGMEAAVAFVFVDEQEEQKRIRIFVMKLSDLYKLCDDDSIEFAGYAADGIQFKYTEGRNRHHLSKIKECSCIDYTELSFTNLTDTVSFLR